MMMGLFWRWVCLLKGLAEGTYKAKHAEANFLRICM